MTWLNEAVLQSNRDRFCTACYATLTIGDGVWQLGSTAAGHPLPIVATTSGTDTLGQPGTLLGVLHDVTTSTAEIDLHAGDVVVFYTDGITDLPPPYGIDTAELIEVVHHLRHLPTAEAVAAGIQRSLHQRVPDRSRQDDVAAARPPDSVRPHVIAHDDGHDHATNAPEDRKPRRRRRLARINGRRPPSGAARVAPHRCRPTDRPERGSRSPLGSGAVDVRVPRAELA